MFSRLKSLFTKQEPAPECFSGLGVVLISDLCNVHLLAERLTPSELVELTSRTVEMQTKIIRRHGGIIDKYIGGCVIAYWAPETMPAAVLSAKSAVDELIESKRHAQVSFDMRVSFAAAEFMVAAFGPEGRKRVQAVGRAYDRADAMQSLVPSGGAVTDAETFAMLAVEDRAGFVERDGYAYFEP